MVVGMPQHCWGHDVHAVVGQERSSGCAMVSWHCWSGVVEVALAGRRWCAVAAVAGVAGVPWHCQSEGTKEAFFDEGSVFWVPAVASMRWQGGKVALLGWRC